MSTPSEAWTGPRIVSDARYHCGKAGCQCPHVEPCRYGWVDAPPREAPALDPAVPGRRLANAPSVQYPQTLPCPRCRPAAHDAVMMAGDRKEQGDNLRAPRPGS